MTDPLAIKRKRTHADLKKAVMTACNRLPWVFLFPAGSGALRAGGRFIRFGMVGVSDLVGWCVRPSDMKCAIGGCRPHPVAPYFVALEIKIGKDALSPEQAAFLQRVRDAGGIGLEIRSVEDAVKALS